MPVGPKVVDLIERPGQVLELPLDADGIRMHVLNALHQVPAAAFSREDHSYAK
jgi:hypothetical protein